MARILVADCDKSVRDLVRLRLTAWGHDVVSFADGQSALQAWREERFDLALLAVDLPRVGGLDVLRAIRATQSDERRAEWPTVVLMSEHGTRGEAALAYESASTSSSSSRSPSGSSPRSPHPCWPTPSATTARQVPA